MRVESMVRLAAALVMTLVYALWIALIANQQPYLVLLAVYFLVLAAAWLAYRKVCWKRSLMLDCIAGGVAGYASMVIVSVVWRCFIHPGGCAGLNTEADLYFFPMVSMGWLYGGVLLMLMGGRRRRL
ncbi:hypothetical protein [Acidovorax sp. A1169]|uniref:hypothetical protein n=1 Tax=Acidovorax sp. A1169 TaxID=3059524 RepID=UPI002737962E|nr:hypothetical protein [Acidovorax sp. A1169]MDP4078283.1 hypothetical protein [Acidovorax sp. A1169]